MTTSRAGAPTGQTQPSLKRMLVLTAVVLVLTVAVLYGLSRWWGPQVLSAGIISILTLAPTVTVLNLRGVLWATGWVAVVCVAAILVPATKWFILAGVLVSSLSQGFFVGGGVAGLNRTPASFLGFANFSRENGTLADVWQPLVGVLIGALGVIILGIVAFGAQRKKVDIPPMYERLLYGGGLALGSLILAAVWYFADWPHLVYPLLAFCIIFAFDSGQVLRNSALRVGGGITGVTFAVLASMFLPNPVIVALMAVSAIVAIALMLLGRQFWFVAFLIATIVLKASLSGEAALVSAKQHITGIVAAALVAVLLHFLAEPIHRRLARRAANQAPATW
ncbi:MAG: hypothetical protein QM728_01145 [Gordonia sp. (in: high G+C Gram-positive bacteria)]|uniref:hypothetical protein n=1 Tax=Gordonia sp. (in: high G+C Gram-positive bacteria) TaxID=84139 RepID=UPI0039E61331